MDRVKTPPLPPLIEGAFCLCKAHTKASFLGGLQTELQRVFMRAHAKRAHAHGEVHTILHYVHEDAMSSPTDGLGGQNKEFCRPNTIIRRFFVKTQKCYNSNCNISVNFLTRGSDCEQPAKGREIVNEDCFTKLFHSFPQFFPQVFHRFSTEFSTVSTG